MARSRRIDAQVTREEGQKAHRRKFGRADGEGADRQREQDERGTRLMNLGAHGRLHVAVQYTEASQMGAMTARVNAAFV